MAIGKHVVQGHNSAEKGLRWGPGGWGFVRGEGGQGLAKKIVGVCLGAALDAVCHSIPDAPSQISSAKLDGSNINTNTPA